MKLAKNRENTSYSTGNLLNFRLLKQKLIHESLLNHYFASPKMVRASALPASVKVTPVAEWLGVFQITTKPRRHSLLMDLLKLAWAALYSLAPTTAFLDPHCAGSQSRQTDNISWVQRNPSSWQKSKIHLWRSEIPLPIWLILHTGLNHFMSKSIAPKFSGPGQHPPLRRRQDNILRNSSAAARIWKSSLPHPESGPPFRRVGATGIGALGYQC